MTPRDEETPVEPLADLQRGMSFLYLFCSAWAITLYLPLRWRTGSQHQGLKAVLGLFIPMFFTLCVPDISVLLIWPVYIVTLYVQRYGHLRTYLRGEIIHTQYSGESWLLQRWFPHVSEGMLKLFHEPCLIVLLGIVTCVLAHGLGLYMIWGAGAMFFKQLMDRLHERQRINAMNDAWIESRMLQPTIRRRW